MPRASKRRIKKVGLPAGSLVYTGERSGGKVSALRIDFSEEACEERSLDLEAGPGPFRPAAAAAWVNVVGIHDPAALERLGDSFGLHRLVLEDILSVVQRPKAEDHGDYLYLVLKALGFHEKTGKVAPEQVSIVLGRGFVLSFQEGAPGDAFAAIRERLAAGRGVIRKRGPDFLAYSLLDSVVDGYFLVLDRFGDRIDALEDELIERPGKTTVERLYELKRELLLLHRSVWPVREVVGALMRRDSSLIEEATVPYLRDVYDHTVQAIDTIEIYREMLSEMIGIYLSSASNRLNAIMKVLTIIATIFMPLTFIAGVYGMNFRHMPELEWAYGYPLALLVMAAIGIAMFVYFRRKDWM